MIRYLYRMTGTVMSRKEIKDSNWGNFIPDVDFTSNSTLKVKTVDRVYEYHCD